jgi:beta-lactamase class A
MLLSGTIPAASQTSTVPIPSIPDTPAGEQLAWTLEQINTSGERLTERRVEQRFAPDYLLALPAPQVIDVFRFYVGPAGPMEIARFEGGVTQTRAIALLSSPGGYWRVTLSVEEGAEHRIDGLLFEPVYLPPPAGTAARSWSSLKHRFAKLAPQTSFIAAEVTGSGCEPLARVEAGTPLAIASSFKLYVLGELARQVTEGQASWDELLPFDSALVSLPNGEMRYSSPGDAFPLAHYAEQMIARSDNTATDHLIARLGREEVEASFARMGHASPELNVPLLMTREWFAIKMRFSDRDIRRYELATTEKRRELIQSLVQPQAATLSEFEPWLAFRALDSIEWFASAADLCTALASLLETSRQPGMQPVLDVLSLEPGIRFDPAIWTYVGYKGGYETGVKSDAWLLQRADGRWFVMAGIINDHYAEIDGWGMADLMIAAADLLSREP